MTHTLWVLCTFVALCYSIPYCTAHNHNAQLGQVQYSNAESQTKKKESPCWQKQLAFIWGQSLCVIKILIGWFAARQLGQKVNL